jgi:alpha-beta hydrolase superfamily lysophospholipase
MIREGECHMNEVNSIAIRQKDGFVTNLIYYACSSTPKASVLILHGMAEHQNRYQSFANFLASNEIDVYIYNHRGHGTNQKLSELGYISSENGYQLLIEDAIAVSDYIVQNNRCKKFFLLGHSMGSLIARNVIQTFPNYNGVILIGTTFPPYLLTLSGLFISNLIRTIKGAKHPSPFMNKLILGNKKYTSLASRTAFDWLTRSNPIVGAYINDPYCGFICTASFYQDLLRLTRRASKKKNIRLVNRELPLFIISGEYDPVGGYGKEILKYELTLKRFGFSNTTTKIYPECRHELINEINNLEIYDDIHQWIIEH